MPSDGPPDDGSRASRNVKLVLMGVAGAALLYSCTPSVGAAVGAWPGLWFVHNPFYRGSAVQTCGPAVPGAPACPPDQTRSPLGGTGSTSTTASTATTGDSSSHASTSARGGFGSSA